MISVCILTKNAAETLAKTLDSTRLFPEVLLLDNGSTDQTLEIAKKYPNVRIVSHPFIGFGPLRNKAAELATHDWILALDSDEVISSPLLLEIQRLNLDENMAYQLPRHNYYNGRRIRGCGWDPEYVARLYHRKKTDFSLSQVHESLRSPHLQTLHSPLLHTPYRSTADFLSKMQHYSTLFAEQYRGKKKSSFPKALLHATYAFLRSYFLKRGLFLGKEGFIISLYNANTTFYKYLKLAELNRKSY
jgi:glycosyltransferase involved in cell wall biosynthesis